MWRSSINSQIKVIFLWGIPTASKFQADENGKMISHSRIFFVANRICEILRCARDIENPPIKLLDNFPMSSRNPITIQRVTKFTF